jgi:hypothetical protein
MDTQVSLVSIIGALVLIVLSLVVASLSSHTKKSEEPLGQFIVLHESHMPLQVRNLPEGPTNLNDLEYYLSPHVTDSPFRKSPTKKSKRSKSPKANRR